MLGYLSLSLNGQTIACTRFSSEEYPRRKEKPEQAQTAASGTFVSFGRWHEDRHRWTVQAIIKTTDMPKLDAIYWEHQRLRRTFQSAAILAIDTTQLFHEGAPRTRAVAPVPFNGVTLSEGGLYVSYYAQFWVWFDTEITYTKLGLYHTQASFELVEYPLKTTPV